MPARNVIEIIDRVKYRDRGLFHLGNIRKNDRSGFCYRIREWLKTHGITALDFWEEGDWTFAGNYKEKAVFFAFNPKAQICECYPERKKIRITYNFVPNEWPLVSEANLIPPECLDHIFSFLDALQLWNCMHVCNRWRAVASNDALWSKLPGSREASVIAISQNKKLWQGYMLCFPWTMQLPIRHHRNYTRPKGNAPAVTSGYCFDKKWIRRFNPYWTRILSIWAKFVFGYTESTNVISNYYVTSGCVRWIIDFACGNGASFLGYKKSNNKIYRISRHGKQNGTYGYRVEIIKLDYVDPGMKYPRCSLSTPLRDANVRSNLVPLIQRTQKKRCLILNKMDQRNVDIISIDFFLSYFEELLVHSKKGGFQSVFPISM